MTALPRTPSFRLAGKRAMVTGASSGIGLAAAMALAEAGAEVTLVARRKAPLEEVAVAMTEAGLAATALPLDITDTKATAAQVTETGPYDILVNSAGLARHAPALTTTETDYDAVTDLNVKAAYFLTRAVAQGLIDAGKPGSLINVSSQMGHVGGIDRAVYCATKHALEGMTKAMAIEWGPHGIRVNTVCPTFIRTPLGEQTLADPARRAWIEGMIKLGRVGEVEDVMGPILLLASDAGALITGSALMIDGGVDGGLMAESKITSLDVARLAGVSQSAVSRVFSGASASKTTAAKVRAAADRLGYRPNSLARAMITGQSRIIGLVVAYLENQFYPVALERLSNALQQRGYHILIFMASNSAEGIDTVMDELMAYQVDGIITASVAMTSTLTDRCAAAGIEVVMFNRGMDGSDLSSVTSANVDGGRKVAQFLVAGGHRRIAHIAGWAGSSTGRDRSRGFVDGLAEAGQEPLASIDGMYDRDTAMEATRRLMARPDPPDAIFVGNDHMAFGVMDVLRQELGRAVPAEVSVVGYDDVPLAGWPVYDLTTVRQPVNRMVEATVNTLLAQIETPDRPKQKIEIAGPLIVRGSARVPRGWTQ